VVEVTAAVVAHGALDISGDFGDVFAQVFDGKRFEVSFASKGVVEIRHIGVVVAAVVNLHGLLVDMGFESVGRIRQWGEGMGHGGVGWG
jgi:hypothetical protein